MGVLTAKVQSVLLTHRKPSPKNNAKGEERRRSSQHPRVIPPEPVQEKPQGDFTLAEIGPALSAHNIARANKGSKKLEWDDRLMRDAEAYAQKLAQHNALEPSGVEDEGENLFMSRDSVDLEGAVKSWLSEEKTYAAQIVGGVDLADWGNFTQCVWHTTKRVGMGKAKGADGATYIVARYSPPGNVPGGKPYA